MNSCEPVGLVYDKNYNNYNFGDLHPLTPKRIEATYRLMKAYNLLENPKVKLLTPRMATKEEVLRVHTQDYLQKLQELSGSKKPNYKVYSEFGLGPGDNPIFPGMYDAAMKVCGATITAADYILKENHCRSFNITGGLHHAHPGMASGFCLLNDIAVGIEYLLHERPDLKIMYIDYDAHHGDGVQKIFYDRPEVLTLSFHQNGKTIFPGTGFMNENGRGAGEGYSLNVPIPPGLIDTIFIETLEEIVPKVMAAYEPDIIVSQNGVDMHFSDPIANIGLSTEGLEKTFKHINRYVEKYSTLNKMLAVGGGGYDIGVVGRVWTMDLAALMGVDIGEPLPDEWTQYIEDIREDSTQFVPEELRDRNFMIEEKQLKDPFWNDELQYECDGIVQNFESNLIPKIKSDISSLRK
ncbi:MAG: acetoin utilization protein AcuC [Promethearchaeota archaeon]